MFALSTSIFSWVERAPEFAAIISKKLQVFERNFIAFRNLQDLAGGDSNVKLNFASVAQQALAFLTPALGELLVFFATIFFYLLSRNNLRHQFVLLFRAPHDRLQVLRIINDIEGHLTRYAVTVTMINLAVGVVTAAGAWLLGFSNPLVFGVLAYVCNYIPYVGPAFMVIILAGVGLVSFPTLEYAAVAPALFVCLTTIEGHFITPRIVGAGLTLSPLAVVLALTFWTWLWGPVGAFLSVPFLIVGQVILSTISKDGEMELPG
jgi:predicted PurR-regulated permease PerM